MNPFTDILICVHATEEFPCEKEFLACVGSVCAHTANYRFIFVDDCSSPSASKVIMDCASTFHSSLYLRTHSQNWFTRAHNRGLRLVRTEKAVMLNCDTVVGPGWLDEMYVCWQEANAAGGGRVGLVGSVYSAEEPRRWFSTKDQAYVTGHCWLVDMEIMEEASKDRGQPGRYLNELDYRHAHIHSDVELCWRLNRMGYQTIQSHKSHVQHYGGRSWGHRLSSVYEITPEYLNSLDGQ